MFNVTYQASSAYIEIDSDMAYLFYFLDGECRCWVYQIVTGEL